MKPINKAFDNGERPINIDISNVVWLDNEKTNWVSSNSNAQISFLLKNEDFRSLFVKLPKGYSGTIKTEGTVLHSVIIQGELNYLVSQENETKVLDPGSYFGSTSKATHTISNTKNDVVLIYIRTNGSIEINE